MSEESNIRYDRQIRLSEIGEEGQKKLSDSKVLVVGAGGLGCSALQFLVSAGIGCIGIIDGDVVNLSNLQRQVLYTNEDLQQPKVLAAKKRLESMNPLVNIIVYNHFIDQENALKILSEYDIIVDGTDQIHIRYILNDACLILQKPLVYGAIHKFEGQVSVFNYNNGPNYRTLFPVPPNPDSIQNCNDIGVVGVLPGMIGIMQANEVLKMILEIGEVLSGKLYTLNTLSMDGYAISIPSLKTNSEKAPRSAAEFLEMNYPKFCGLNFENDISVEDSLSLLQQNTVLIDIRDSHERPLLEIDHVRAKEIDLAGISESYDNLLIICQKGIRSRKYVEEHKKRISSNMYSIEGGVEKFNSFQSTSNIKISSIVNN